MNLGLDQDSYNILMNSTTPHIENISDFINEYAYVLYNSHRDGMKDNYYNFTLAPSAIMHNQIIYKHLEKNWNLKSHYYYQVKIPAIHNASQLNYNIPSLISSSILVTNNKEAGKYIQTVEHHPLWLNLVNSHIAKNTRRLIKSAATKPVCSNNIFVNGTYFIAELPFNKKDTVKGQFTSTKSHTTMCMQLVRTEYTYQTELKLVNMMTKHDCQFPYCEGEYYKLMEINLKDNLSIGFMIGKEGAPYCTYDGLNYLINNLKLTGFTTVKIPKIETGTRINLNKHDSADVSFIHTAIINIKEDDKISQPTNLTIGITNSFILNKSFMYYVRDKTTSNILIIGLYA